MANVRIIRQFTVNSYVESTWWAMTFLSLLGALSSEVVDPWLGVVGLSLSVWVLLPFSERWLWARPRFAFLFLFAVLCSVQAIRAFHAEQDVLVLTGDNLIGFFPLALFYRRKTLGYWLTFLFSFLLSLAGVVAEGEVNAYFFFITFLAVGAANLNAAHLLQLTGPSQARIQTLSPRYFRQFATSALAGFAFGAFIFFAFPREYSWTNPLGMRQKNRSLGFSNSISLDGSSVVADSDALAFSVDASDASFLALYARDLYFRGTSVDTFDGVNWSGAIRLFRYFKNDRDMRLTTSHTTQIIKLKIYREGTSSPYIFYPPVLRAIEFSNLRMSSVNSDQSGNLSRIRPDQLPFVYQLWVSNEIFPSHSMSLSELAGAVSDWDGAGDLPSSPTQRQIRTDLFVPASIKSAPYFQNWMKEIRLDPKRDSLFTALNKIKIYFRHNFKATLIHDLPQDRAFESFLTTARKGHCEYFVTAAALFLRMYGIPTRPVLGYMGGNFNPVSHVVEVRETNAHAWLEVFYPGEGWFTFDPTPLRPAIATSNWFARTAEHWESVYSAIQFWFNLYVAEYNGRTQLAVLQSISFHRSGQERKLAAIPMRQWFYYGLFLILGALVVLYFRVRGRRKHKTVPSYYQFFLEKIERYGFKKEDGESYRDFHSRLIGAGFHEETVREVGKVIEIDLYSKFRTQSHLRKQIRRTVRTRLRRVRA